METQADYEADVRLAVFRSKQSAERAIHALRAGRIQHTQTPLVPGHYQVADLRLNRYTRAVIGAAVVGAVIGAIIGIGLALWFFGAAWQIATWFGVAGAGGGAVIGSLVGLQVRAQYDADIASMIDVGAEPSAVLITTYTSQADPGHAEVREILQRAGAVAFLDVASYEAHRGVSAGTIVESTSAGRR